MPKDRIFFPGNPWPEGHPIKDFQWTLEVRDGVVWFHLHLETEDYDSEREIELNLEAEEEEDTTEWESAIVWDNYCACTLSSTFWGNEGFPVCPAGEYNVDSLDGFIVNVDPLPIDLSSSDFEISDLAFHIYLLGHDSVAGHQIQFTKNTEEKFDISWKGKIALLYAGEYDYDYSFHTLIKGVPAPQLP